MALLVVLGAEIGFFTDFIAQSFESAGFLTKDFDPKRSALSTGAGGLSAGAGVAVGAVGLGTVGATGTAILIDSGLDTGVQAATTDDPNFDTTEAFGMNVFMNTMFAGVGAAGGKIFDSAKKFLGFGGDGVVEEGLEAAAPNVVPPSGKRPPPPPSEPAQLELFPPEGVSGNPRQGPRERADELHLLLDERAQRERTTAVTEVTMPDESRIRVVTSSERRLSRRQRLALEEGEFEGVGPGHAEVTGVEEAKRLGGKPEATAASRPICEGTCEPFLEAEGVKPASPLESETRRRRRN